MKFVDQVRVYVRAGDGGSGAVAWRREKYVPRGGPAGGDGGRGGDVVLVADAHVSTLLDLRFRQHLVAKHGRPGGTRGMNGRAGEPLRVRVPIGTLVVLEGYVDDATERPWRFEDETAGSGTDDDELETIYILDDGREAPRPTPVEVGSGGSDQERGTVLGDLTRHGEELVVASGGLGGRGNIHFRSSTNRAPDFAEPGKGGESMWLRLELKLLADVGIVGFPNVGKSTLIRKVSRARPRVGAYPFTTLVPQLGVVRLGEGRSMVVADVPGLIEGASDGRGLGHQFLRHLERTRVLLHLLAPDPTPGRDPAGDFETIEAELQNYGRFAHQPRVVALNKHDLLGDEAGRRRVRDLRAWLRARNIPLFVVSAQTGEGVDALLEALWRRVAGAPADPNVGPA